MKTPSVPSSSNQLRGQPSPPKPASAGFTIIESLVAIVVVTILLISLAPVITMSVAVRVQARRVELAARGARAYIDRLRAGTVTAPTIATGTTMVDNVPTGASDSSIRACIDRNGTVTFSTPCAASQLLFIQARGYNSSSTDATMGYRLNVRVYRLAALTSGGTLLKSSDQNAFTGGTGIGSTNLPLFETSTEVAPSSSAYDSFCQRLGGC